MLRVLNGAPVPEFPNASAAGLEYFASLQNVLVYNASYGPTTAPGLQSWPASSVDTDEAAAAFKAVQAGKIIVAANGNQRREDLSPVAGRNPSGLALYPFIEPANAGAGVYQDDGNNFNFSSLRDSPA